MSDKTAWGEVKMKIAETEALETFPIALVDLGIIKEDSLSISKEDGTKLQLFGEGHVLVDELQLEPTLKIALQIVGISDVNKAKFWDATTTGTGDAAKFAVKSLVNTKKFAIQFAATKVVGSDTFEAPKCTVTLSPLYSSKEGWMSDVQITVIKAITGTLFQFGKVPTA